ANLKIEPECSTWNTLVQPSHTFVLTGLNISIIGTELTQDHVPHRALRSIPRRKTRASGRVLRPVVILAPACLQVFHVEQNRILMASSRCLPSRFPPPPDCST